MTKTANLIEHIVVNKHYITEQQISNVLNTINHQELYSVTAGFLQGVAATPALNQLTATLISFKNYFLDNKEFTSKQRWMLFNLLIENWDHVGLQGRVDMGL